MMWIFGGLTLDKKFDDFWKFLFKELQWIEIKLKDNKSVIFVKCFKAIIWMYFFGVLYMFGGLCFEFTIFYFWSYLLGILQWIKLGGIIGVIKCVGKYGEMGIVFKKNYSGCREGVVFWVDQQDNLWMFGGLGFDNFFIIVFVMLGFLFDFWMYNVLSYQWTWIGGLSREEGVLFFGKKGKADLRNIFGFRESVLFFFYEN